MPAAAYALLALFTAVSAASGLFAARVVGPWRRWTPVVPTLASFGALYLVGHRLGLSAGPSVTLFGFRVSLVLDLAVALGAAFAAAAIQAAAVRLFDPQQRRAGGHGDA